MNRRNLKNFQNKFNKILRFAGHYFWSMHQSNQKISRVTLIKRVQINVLVMANPLMFKTSLAATVIVSIKSRNIFELQN